MTRVQLIEINAHGSDVAVFFDGNLIITADPSAGDDIESVYTTAENIAATIGEGVDIVEYAPSEDWEWDEIESELKDAKMIFTSNISPLLVAGTGRLVNIFDLQPKDFDVPMIARALSRIGRFFSQTTKFYSVAEHCLIMEGLLTDPVEKRWALAHELFEAYSHDIPSPVKSSPQMAPFRRAEELCLQRAADHFGLPRVMPTNVKALDKSLMISEAFSYMPATEYDWREISDPVPGLILGDPMSMEEAEEAFLARWYELFDFDEEEKVA